MRVTIWTVAGLIWFCVWGVWYVFWIQTDNALQDQKIQTIENKIEYQDEYLLRIEGKIDKLIELQLR